MDNKIYGYIKGLINYGKEKGLVRAEDEIFLINQLFRCT